MANVNVTSDAWTEISITSGTVQNISATADIELSAEQIDNSGVVLKPSGLYQWDNETIYARAVTEATGALRVVNFKKAAGGGGSYVLPVATASKLGGVKVGSNLSIDKNGVLSATGGGSSDYDPVGRVVFDVVLRDGYIKANGATVADATTALPNLLQFVQNNPSLLAANQAAYDANHGLYLYDSGTDTLTLPNFIKKFVECGNTVEEKEAGLPNITGSTQSLIDKNGTNIGTTGKFGQLAISDNANAPYHNGVFTVLAANESYANGQGISTASVSNRSVFDSIVFDASKSDSTYGNSTTVQPPAITLIPQIKY